MGSSRRSSGDVASKTTEGASTMLEAPRFAFPADFETNRSRYQIWSIRVPVAFDVSQLDHAVLSLDHVADAAAATSSRSNQKKVDVGPLAVTQFSLSTANEQTTTTRHALMEGAKDEADSFRILVRDPEDETENSSNTMMVAASTTFDRHLHLRELPEETTTNNNTMSMEDAPATYRNAYAPIPQVTGMKRRWTTPGAATAKRIKPTPTPAALPPTTTTPATPKNEPSRAAAPTTPSSVVTKESKEEKSARKKEKKLEKKAKKEKKSEKKAKKEKR